MDNLGDVSLLVSTSVSPTSETHTVFATLVPSYILATTTTILCPSSSPSEQTMDSENPLLSIKVLPVYLRLIGHSLENIHT